MMKNIAVVLRGHVRTWSYNAPVVFDFFEHNQGDFFTVDSYSDIDYEDIPYYS